MTLRLESLALVTAFAAVIAPAAAPAADGNAENGKRLFFSTAQCKTCHAVEAGQKRIGPSLFGIVGRKCGAAERQNYSSNYEAACAKAPFTWDEAALDGYLADPAGYIAKITGQNRPSPMTRKTAKPQDRADIIAYLKTLK